MKKWIKFLLICLAALAVMAGLTAAYYYSCMYPYRGTVNKSGFGEALPLDTVLTQDEAREDLSFLMERIESRHPAWLEEDSDIPETVAAQFDAELAALGDEVTILELLQAASRITSVMHDGHTWVRYVGEEMYVDDLTEFTGGDNTVTAINGEPVSEIYSRFLKLFQYELEPYAVQIFTQVIIRENYLRLMGVDTSDGVSFTFKNNDEKTERHYSFVPAEEIRSNNSAKGEYKWVNYDIDAEKSTAVFTLKECNYNDEYCAVTEEFFTIVNENNISNIIVDLRGNGGGNSMVANEFLRYVNVGSYNTWDSDIRHGWYIIRNRDIVIENDPLDIGFLGDIYVLTDTETFSAAMDFAMLIGDNDIGAIIGEASGNRPDAYGDILYFQMPNSKIGVGISHKRWYRIDSSKAWQPLEPDYPTKSKDAMEKAYELIAAK